MESAQSVGGVGVAPPSSPPSSSPNIPVGVESQGTERSGVPSGTPSRQNSFDKSGISGTKEATPQGGQAEYFDLKVNGKTVKIGRQEMMDRASMSYAANERFNEAARIRAEHQKFLKMSQSDPVEALKAAGLKEEFITEAFEKWYVKNKIEPESLSPQERRSRDLEAEVNRYKQENEQRKTQEKEAQESQMTQREVQKYQQDIITALDSSKLPKLPFFAQMTALLMHQNKQRGWEAPMDLVARQVERESGEILSGIADNTSVEKLIQLCPSLIQKIRKHDLDQLRARRNKPPISENFFGNDEPERRSDGMGRVDTSIDYDEVKRRLRELTQ